MKINNGELEAAAQVLEDWDDAKNYGHPRLHEAAGMLRRYYDGSEYEPELNAHDQARARAAVEVMEQVIVLENVCSKLMAEICEDLRRGVSAEEGGDGIDRQDACPTGTDERVQHDDGG